MLINSQVNLTKWQHRYNKNSKLYLVEGDSWYQYIGQKSGIVLDPYDIPTFLSEHLDIYSFALLGDTIRNMSNESNLKYIKDRLSYVLHSDTHSKTIAGMLISGGGNDLFDNLKSLLKSSSSTNPEDYINEEKLGEFFTITKSYFIKFIDGCKQFLNEDVKYFLHTYDYVDVIGEKYKSWFTTINSWESNSYEKFYQK